MQKQKIIIFCGPDRCGKTNISKELSKKLNIPYFKASSEHQTFLKDKSSFKDQLRHADPRMIDFLKQTGYSAIFDRGYPCEFVYSQVFNRDTDFATLEMIDEAYAALNTLIIIPHRTSYVNIKDDLDPRLTGDFLHVIDNKYVEFSRWTKCHTFFLNVDDEDMSRELKDIDVWMRACKL